MKAVELTVENVKQQQKETERKNRYPAALPTAFVPKGSEDETQESRARFESKKSLRNLSMRSDSADSVISHVPRNQDGAELPRKNGTTGVVKKRRMSTLDVLYQMQTQQLEEESPRTTCSEKSIHPHSEFRTRWDVFVAFCLAYNAVTIPFRICFNNIASADEAIFWVDRCVDLAFIVDVGLNFFTGFVRAKDNQIELHPPNVKWNYFTTWFFVDIISSIPYELLVIAVVDLTDASDARGAESAQLLKSAKALKIAKYIRFIKIAKVLRLVRAVHIVKRFEKALVMRHNSISIIKFILFIFYLNHIMSCIFYLIGDIEFSNGRKSWLEMDNLYTAESSMGYLYAFYWSLMTITTIGYGDIHPVSPPGRIFGLVAMMIGATVFAYGVTNVLEMMSAMNQQEQAFREKMDRISSYMNFRNLPKGLKSEVREFFHYTHSTKTEKRMLEVEKEILAEMSPSLSHEVVLFVNRSIVDKVVFFRECDHRFFQRIVRSLEPATFAPNELVMKEGEPGSKLYIISKGVVELLHGEQLMRVDTRADGSHFGMISIIEKGPTKGNRVCSVRTLTYCDFRTISKRAFNRGLRRYPEVKHDVRRLVTEEYEAFQGLIQRAKYMQRSGLDFSNKIGGNGGLKRVSSVDSLYDETSAEKREGGNKNGNGDGDTIDPGNRSDSDTSISGMPDSPKLSAKLRFASIGKKVNSQVKTNKNLSLSMLRRHSDMRRSSGMSLHSDKNHRRGSGSRRASDFRDIIEEESEDQHVVRGKRSSSLDWPSGADSPTFHGGGMTIEQTEQLSEIMVRLQIFLDAQDKKELLEKEKEKEKEKEDGLEHERKDKRNAMGEMLKHAIDDEENDLKRQGIVLSTGETAPLPPPPPMSTSTNTINVVVGGGGGGEAAGAEKGNINVTNR